MPRYTLELFNDPRGNRVEKRRLLVPTVAERLLKLGERGVLKGYGVDVNPRAFGYPLKAIVKKTR